MVIEERESTPEAAWESVATERKGSYKISLMTDEAGGGGTIGSLSSLLSRSLFRPGRMSVIAKASG